MNKTIEEVAKDFAHKWNMDCDSDPYDQIERTISDAFKAGANHILSLPLAERLTEEEKRKLRCRYHTNECVIRDHRKRTGDKAQTKAVARIKFLESIFGADFFKEKNEVPCRQEEG